ncbi:class C beta-lactamase-related serine hydrolase [candidate division KSB1 bacterium]|nr:serine hydrolase [candidate division KSB1 bacterium]RQW04176.1 MAG: class C beta-lactamase-related serine hydrolase [candidate division KSB1 bacterium]
MKKIAIQLLISCLLLGNAAVSSFETSTPEAQGISSQAILDFVNAVEEQVDALHSFMLMRHGHVVARGWWAPYNAESPHMLYSLSKSFTATAIGLAIDEGLLSLDDTVFSFFPDETPAEPSANLKAMRIRDLLAMNTGHELDTTGQITNADSVTWVEAFLGVPVEFKPGTHFVYNSGASFMLSAILQKVTGETLLAYLTPRLFEPLGIKNPTWESNPQGINMGGWGLKVKTEDIAKFGQLYLQKGMWQEQRLLSEDWVKAASSRQTSNGSNPDSDWEQGYGYQFWRCRHNIYRGDGAFGQYCIIMPEQDAVLAITGGLGDMQKPMTLAWDILLPAMEDHSLPENAPVQKKLQNKLATLALKTVSGEASSLHAQKSTGTWIFDQNPYGIKSVTLNFSNNPVTIKVLDNQGERHIACGHGVWEKSSIPFMSDRPEPVAACGAWIEPHHYQVKLCAYETPYIQQLDFNFAGKELLFDLKFNVSFGSGTWEQLKALLEL